MIEEKSKNPEEKVLLTIGDDDIKEENFQAEEPKDVKIIQKSQESDNHFA